VDGWGSIVYPERTIGGCTGVRYVDTLENLDLDMGLYGETRQCLP
jgi:hypothetical protein